MSYLKNLKSFLCYDTAISTHSYNKNNEGKKTSYTQKHLNWRIKLEFYMF